MTHFRFGRREHLCSRLAASPVRCCLDRRDAIWTWNRNSTLLVSAWIPPGLITASRRSIKCGLSYIYIYIYILHYIIFYYIILYYNIASRDGDKFCPCRLPIYYIYIYINTHIGGWGDETNREIVSFRFVRSCVRARGLVVEWNFGSIQGLCPFPFPFSDHEPFPFPFGAPPPAPQPPIQL